MGELVLLDPVPHIESKYAAGAKHSPHLGERSWFVREKHDAELTNNGVKGLVGEGESDDIRLSPLYPSPGADRPGLFQHPIIQVCRDNGNALRQGGGQRASHHAGSRGNFEDSGKIFSRQPADQIRRLWFENHRHEIFLIEFRDRTIERGISV